MKLKISNSEYENLKLLIDQWKLQIPISYENEYCNIDYNPVYDNIIILAIIQNHNILYCYDLIPEYDIKYTKDLSFIIKNYNNDCTKQVTMTELQQLVIKDTNMLDLGIHLLNLKIKSKGYESEWIGTINNRMKFEDIKVINSTLLKSKYGIFYNYELNYNNNIVIWTSNIILTVNNIYTLTGTIVSHLELAGRKKTKIKNVTIKF